MLCFIYIRIYCLTPSLLSSTFVMSSSALLYSFSFFFFKQKTAYGMRISDWSSDVCSSDLLALNAGELTVQDAAMAKWWTTELQKRVVDQCVQLHGGYGYMLEYPVAKAFIDSRVQTIYGGTTEVMKEIIGRSLGV